MFLKPLYISLIICQHLSCVINYNLNVCLHNHLIILFFCTLGPFLHPYNAYKSDYHSTSCVCLSYSSSHLGYHRLDLSSYHIHISYHICFHEYYFSFIESEQVHNTSPYVFTPTLNTNLPLLTTFPLLNTSSPWSPLFSYLVLLSPFASLSLDHFLRSGFFMPTLSLFDFLIVVTHSLL